MKKIALVLSALCIVLFAATAILAAPKKSLKKGIVVSESQSLTAVVEEIDHQARTAKLKGPQGNIVDLKVTEEARNFNQIRKGDTVNLTYHASLLLKLQKTTQAPANVKHNVMQSIPKKQKSKVVQVDRFDGMVVIDGINEGERTITVRNPKGEVRTHTIGKSVSDFKTLQVGDQIYYSYHVATVLEVRNP